MAALCSDHKGYISFLCVYHALISSPARGMALPGTEMSKISSSPWILGCCIVATARVQVASLVKIASLPSHAELQAEAIENTFSTLGFLVLPRMLQQKQQSCLKSSERLEACLL